MGNEQTKEFVVRRELLFAENQTINTSELDSLIIRSKENLLNTSLFNYVYINAEAIDSENITHIFIRLEERWYFWPRLILAQGDHNFSSWMKSRDLGMIYYGSTLNKYNFRGRKETLGIQFIWGFLRNIGVFYHDFYPGKQRKHGFDASYQFSAQKKLAYTDINNILKYYQSVDAIIYRQHHYQLNYSYRPKTDHIFFLETDWYNYQIADTILKLNKNYLSYNEQNAQYLKTKFKYQYSTHDYKYYPQTGHSIEAHYQIIHQMPTGKRISEELMLKLKSYQDISPNWIWVNSLEGRYNTVEKRPYIFSKSIGYTYNIRGYEPYVINGDYMATWHQEFKYKLLINQVSELETISSTKFNKVPFSYFFNVFTEVGYVAENRTLASPLANRWLYSAGLGIDFVTYYDKIVRMEFSINHKAETGFSIHFKQAF